MALNLHQILAVDDNEIRELEVPQWNNAKIRLRRMTIKDYIDYSKEVNPEMDEGECMFRMLKYTLVGDDNKPLIKSEEDLNELKGKNEDAIVYIFKEMADLNRLVRKAELAEKAKN